MTFCIYDKETGHISGSLSIDSSLVHLYETDTQGLVEGAFLGHEDMPTHYVEEGQPYPRIALQGVSQGKVILQTSTTPIETLTGLPDDLWVRIRPNGRMNFYEQTIRVSSTLAFPFEEAGVYTIEPIGKYKGGPWTVEAIDLQALIERRCLEVDEQRKAIVEQGLLWDGHRWDADEKSVAALRTYMGAVPAGFYFTDYDNNHVPLSTEKVDELALAMSTFTFAVHGKTQALKTALRACQTIEDVMAQDIISDWPI